MLLYISPQPITDIHSPRLHYKTIRSHPYRHSTTKLARVLWMFLELLSMALLRECLLHTTWELLELLAGVSSWALLLSHLSHLSHLTLQRLLLLHSLLSLLSLLLLGLHLLHVLQVLMDILQRISQCGLTPGFRNRLERRAPYAV